MHSLVWYLCICLLLCLHKLSTYLEKLGLNLSANFLIFTPPDLKTFIKNLFLYIKIIYLCALIIFYNLCMYCVEPSLVVYSAQYTHSCIILQYTMRPKTRGLAQHGTPPSWLEESEPGWCDFCTWWTVNATCPDGPHHLPQSGSDLLLNVHKISSWVTSRKESMAWYSSRPKPSLW